MKESYQKELFSSLRQKQIRSCVQQSSVHILGDSGESTHPESCTATIGLKGLDHCFPKWAVV